MSHRSHSVRARPHQVYFKMYILSIVLPLLRIEEH